MEAMDSATYLHGRLLGLSMAAFSLSLTLLEADERLHLSQKKEAAQLRLMQIVREMGGVIIQGLPIIWARAFLLLYPEIAKYHQQGGDVTKLPAAEISKRKRSQFSRLII